MISTDKWEAYNWWLHQRGLPPVPFKNIPTIPKKPAVAPNITNSVLETASAPEILVEPISKPFVPGNISLPVANSKNGQCTFCQHKFISRHYRDESYILFIDSLTVSESEHNNMEELFNKIKSSTHIPLEFMSETKLAHCDQSHLDKDKQISFLEDWIDFHQPKVVIEYGDPESKAGSLDRLLENKKMVLGYLEFYKFKKVSSSIYCNLPHPYFFKKTPGLKREFWLKLQNIIQHLISK